MTENNNVVQVSFGRQTLNRLKDDLTDVISKYAGEMGLAEAIGILVLLQHELMQQAED